MNTALDRKTDLVAVVISAIVALTIWGLFVYEFVTAGAVPTWLMGIAVLFTLLAVITLFGAEKVRQALELRRGE